MQGILTKEFLELVNFQGVETDKQEIKMSSEINNVIFKFK